MTHPALLIGLVIASYLFGSIPIGMMVARGQGIDIFGAGSGNPGATNIWREVGPGWGLLVFALDIGKGLVPTLACRWIDPDQVVWFAVGLVAVVGHSMSPFAHFRGGKGVSTALGASLGAAPLVALPAFGVWLIVLALFRFVSLASTVAALSTIFFAIVVPGQSRMLIPLFALVSVLVILRHRANYGRILRAEEPKFRFSKNASQRSEENSDAPGESNPGEGG